MVVGPLVVTLNIALGFGGTPFQLGLASAGGGVVRQVAPDALVGGNPDGALTVH